jgi:hypothetical protein
MHSLKWWRRRPHRTAIAVAVLALAMATPGRAADEETEAAAARAAVYGLLMKSGYLVNRTAAKCYCLGVRHVDAGAVTIEDPPAAAIPASPPTGPRVEPYSQCREACVVLYTSDLTWVDDSMAKTRGGFLTIYSRLPLKGTPPRPDARMFTVEEQPGRGWVVIRSEKESAP